jgi:beta-1,4-mannosyl-glycoprotein beta-1,4-N-acetylglucosaminyltransferase
MMLFHLLFLGIAVVQCKKHAKQRDLQPSTLLQPVASGLSTPYVIDLIMFDGEDIGELHLEYLYDYVDLFILVESSKTFSGHPKDLSFYHTEYLMKYEKKLLKLLVTEFPEPSADATSPRKIFFEREAFQRNYALDIITTIVKNRPALIFSLDVDEFPSRESIQQAKQDYMENKLGGDIFHLNLQFSKYNFGWDLGNWTLPILLTDKALASRPNFNNIRVSRAKLPLKNGGWHGSYFMSANRILKKMNAFSHAKDNIITKNPVVKTSAWINRCIDEGLDLFNHATNSSDPRHYTKPVDPSRWKLPDCENCHAIMKKYNFLPSY